MIGPGKKEIDVFVQDQTSPLFQYFLMNEQKVDITLTSDVSIDNTVINVSAGHGFTAAPGEYITVFENERFIQAKVKSVAADAVTVYAPLQTAFTAAGAQVIRGNINMNVDGSGTPVEFKLHLRDATVPVDISKIIITMQHGANVPDDGKFGGLAALVNGLFFKKVNDSTFSLGNYIENQDFKDVGGDVNYTDKGQGGTNATDIVFDVKKTFGQVIRIHPSVTDMIVGIVRDAISSVQGMDKLTTSVVGSYTEGEA
jgi:hypothetical protein